MSLKIKESNGAFLLEGIINSSTIKQFKDHLEFLLTYSKSVTINIEKVTAINKNGLKVIESLFEQANAKNKKLYIIGYGCKDIYESMNMSQVRIAI